MISLKKNIFILILAISSFIFSKDLGYIIKDDTIVYREEIEGTKKEYELPFINKESFEIIDDIYAKNNISAFYKGKRIDFSDPKTFTVLSQNIAKDKYRIFYNGEILSNNLNTKDIEVVNKYYIKDKYYYYGINEYKSKDYSVYGKNFTNKNLAKITNRIKITPDMKIQDEYLISKENISYLGKKIDNIDLNTFQNLKYGISKDKNNIYFNGINIKFLNGIELKDKDLKNIGENYFRNKNNIYIVTDSDIDNEFWIYKLNLSSDLLDFKVISKDYFINNGIGYYKTDQIGKIDEKTFKIIRDKYSKDKNNIYFENKIIKNVDKNTFEILGYDYSRDRNNVYYRDKIYLNFIPKEIQVIDKIFLVTDDKVYFKSDKKPEIEKDFFKIIDDNFIAINDEIYYFIFDGGLHSFRVENSKKFRNIGFNFYSDDSNIYYYDKKIKKIDKNSIRIINKNYISDKNNIFYKDKILENIDRSTFEIIDEVNSRDIHGNYIDRCYNIFTEYCNEEYIPEIINKMKK